MMVGMPWDKFKYGSQPRRGLQSRSAITPNGNLPTRLLMKPIGQTPLYLLAGSM